MGEKRKMKKINNKIIIYILYYILIYNINFGCENLMMFKNTPYS